MPFELIILKRLKKQGWKVKVREKKRLEPPHVTIICGKKEWRVGLRDGGFLIPPVGAWSDIDTGVRAAVAQNWAKLQEAADGSSRRGAVRSVTRSVQFIHCRGYRRRDANDFPNSRRLSAICAAVFVLRAVGRWHDAGFLEGPRHGLWPHGRTR